MAFLVSDLSLIRRLHRALTAMSIAYGEAKAALEPGAPCDSLHVGGGTACFFGPGDPLNEVTGLGLDGPVDPAQIEAIERFYAERDAKAPFWVAPCADPSLLSLLVERGYRPSGMEQVWVRPLEGPLPAPESVPVEATDEYAAWAAGWLEGFGFPPAYELAARAMCTPAGAQPFWVRDGGRPVAVANMAMHEGVVLLFGGATLPAYRGRGYQTALLQERLRVAQARGCDLAVVETGVANNSARNCERAGFRVLYTKLKLAK